MPYTIGATFVKADHTTSATPNTVETTTLLNAPPTGFRYRIMGFAAQLFQSANAACLIRLLGSGSTAGTWWIGALSTPGPASLFGTFPAPGILLPVGSTVTYITAANFASQSMSFGVYYYLEAGE